MKKVYWIILLICLSMSAWGWNSMLLEGLIRPSILIVHQDRIFVLDQTTVFIFRLEDGRLIRKFGKAGEGPGEFKYLGNNGRPLSMSFQKNRLAVNSVNRITWFSQDGVYEGERNLPVDMLLFEIGEQYIGVGPINDEKEQSQKIGFRFYDRNIRPGSLIYRSELDVGNPSKLMIPADSFAYNPVYRNRIYINTDPEEFVIDVFDSDGKKLYQIAREAERIPVDEEYRKMTLHFFEVHPRWKRMAEMLKRITVFRDYFPRIRDLHLASERIHVFTYRRNGDDWEMLVLDLKGNPLARLWVPLSEYEPFSLYPLLYSVSGNSLYSLVEEDDEEGWQIRRTEIPVPYTR